MPPPPVRGCCWQPSVIRSFYVVQGVALLTRSISRAAMRSMGRMKRKKKMDRIAKPFAARVWTQIVVLALCDTGAVGGMAGKRTHDDAVIPSEYGQFIEARNKVPASGDVASYEDA